MYGEFFGILTALGYAFQGFLVKKGLPGSTSITAAFTSMLTAASLLWIYTAFFGSVQFNPLLPNIYFVLAGLCSPAISWPMYFEGIKRMGVSRAGPIISSSPIFSTLGAVIFMGEKPTIGTLIGTILIVAGVALISAGGEKRQWRGRDILYPLIASVCFGISAMYRKIGIGSFGNPIFGATIIISTGFIFMTVINFTLRRFGQFKFNSQSCFYFLLAGLASSFAYSFYMQALKYGEVNVIAPLVNMGPLFILILTFLFLREIEKLTAKVVVGSTMVVFGGAMIMAF